MSSLPSPDPNQQAKDQTTDQGNRQAPVILLCDAAVSPEILSRGFLDLPNVFVTYPLSSSEYRETESILGRDAFSIVGGLVAKAGHHRPLRLAGGWGYGLRRILRMHRVKDAREALASAFLNWYSLRQGSLSKLSIHHIDKYIAQKQRDGWSSATLSSSMQALRIFVRYAHTQGWCPDFSDCIKAPYHSRLGTPPQGRGWDEVVQLLETMIQASFGTIVLMSFMASGISDSRTAVNLAGRFVPLCFVGAQTR